MSLLTRRTLSSGFLLFVVCCFWMSECFAGGFEREDALKGLVSKSRKTMIQSIAYLGELNDPSTLPILEALKAKALVTTKAGQIVILGKDKKTGRDIMSGETIAIQGRVKKPRVNNTVRRALSPVIGQLQLVSPDLDVRLKAVEEITKRPTESAIAPLRAALENETEPEVKEAIQITLAIIDINSKDPTRRLEAIATLGDSGDRRFKGQLEKLLVQNEDGSFVEASAAIRSAAKAALQAIENHVALIEILGHAFRGISLGSVLLIAALGLAITFGLMQVINMAHGEMLMLGAYTTYLVQNFFIAYFPSAFSWYLLVAMPLAFAVTALIGILLERSVIRFLYGRPLETLLATWGISLLLIQTVRLIFGAQNVEVANPDWLSGGAEVAQGLVLPYSRIAIIFFVILVTTLVWLLLVKTPIGLKVRAVTQNRSMASCMGVSAAKTDMWTFGLGSGIAGLGGVALSQLGNVGPELGQLYIVDSFMVVVLGGVGKISGTVVSAMGLGLFNKYLEPFSGAVFGKIFILGIIIVVLQMRPQGLFAPKGRLIEN